MAFVALPHAGVVEIGDVLRTAPRAADGSIGPPDRFNSLAAVVVIREEDDRFAEGFGCGVGSHE
jgi:hypothetical protein